ncbi:DUF2815 family protein [Tessaracoccus sp.]
MKGNTMAPAGLPTKVITGKARTSYCHVLEAYSNSPDQAPKFSTVLLIPKSDKTTMKKLREAQANALKNGEKTVFKGKIPANWGDTIHDGDEDADLERNPEYAGCWYLSVSAKTRPGVVDQALNPITDTTEMYSGCYVRASLNAFAYSQSGNKGVSFGLNNIQKMADGEPLGGRSRAEDDFEELDSEDDGEGVL